MGVAHHTHFLAWFEMGRTQLMRDLGCPYGDLEDDEGVFFPVIRVEAAYRRPARYDEVVTVWTRLVAVGAVSASGSSTPSQGKTMRRSWPPG